MGKAPTACIAEAMEKVAAEKYNSVDEMRECQLQLAYRTHYQFLKRTRRLVLKSGKLNTAAGPYLNQPTVTGYGSENEPGQSEKDPVLIIGFQILSQLTDGMGMVLESAAERITLASNLFAENQQWRKRWNGQEQLPARLMDLTRPLYLKPHQKDVLRLEKDVKEIAKVFMGEASLLEHAAKEDESWNLFRESLGLPRVVMPVERQRLLAHGARVLTRRFEDALGAWYAAKTNLHRRDGSPVFVA